MSSAITFNENYNLHAITKKSIRQEIRSINCIFKTLFIIMNSELLGEKFVKEVNMLPFLHPRIHLCTFISGLRGH